MPRHISHYWPRYIIGVLISCLLSLTYFGYANTDRRIHDNKIEIRQLDKRNDALCSRTDKLEEKTDGMKDILKSMDGKLDNLLTERRNSEN